MNDLIFLAAGAALGVPIGLLLMKSKLTSHQQDRDTMLAKAKADCEKLREQALKDAAEESKSMLESNEAHIDKLEGFLQDREKALEEKTALVTQLLKDCEKNIKEMENAAQTLDAKRHDLEDKQAQTEKRLAEIAALSEDEARVQILDKAEESAAELKDKIFKEAVRRARDEAELDARNLLLEAMQRYSAECASDRTTATVYLPADEMKGRIIGRDGRNIRTLEQLTGANILIDDTPETVVVSCFEPLRRETARIALEKLVEDGRIHPNKIHEVIQETKGELEKEMHQAVNTTAKELNIGPLDESLVKQMGLLKFRFNSCQNLLQYAREVACLMGLLATEIGLDVTLAKRTGFLHAVGHSFDEHTENNAPTSGADFLRRHGEVDELVLAVREQKNNFNPNNALSALLYIAIQCSKNRPGSRDEIMEIYIKRLHQMEQIVQSFREVRECIVLQSGREVLVHVDPKKVGDKSAPSLAHTISSRLESELKFPGEIQVIISRESRYYSSTDSKETGHA